MSVPVYVKPAVRSAWAQSAGSADLVDPGDTFTTAGWLIGVKPPRQYFNWLLNWASNGVRYICQNGVVDYDSAEVYQVASITMGPDNLVYQSIAANNTNNTPSSSPTFWGPLRTATPGTSDNSNNVATTAYCNAAFLLKTSTVGSLPGTVTNAQVPLAAVAQWQGSLSINFSQLIGQINPSQVPVNAVTQWQSSLAIAWGQITGTKNADQLEGLTASVSPAANTIAARDPNGYLQAAYFNQSSGNNENPTISQVMVTNGADNYLRKTSLASLITAVFGGSVPFSGGNPGYLRIPGTPFYLQFGTFSYGGSGTLFNIGFGLAFPNAALAALCVGNIGGFQPGVSSLSKTGLQLNFNNLGGQPLTVYWFAIGD